MKTDDSLTRIRLPDSSSDKDNGATLDADGFFWVVVVALLFEVRAFLSSSETTKKSMSEMSNNVW